MNKEQLLERYKEKFAKASSVILADYSGLTVEKVNSIRRYFREAEVEYLVVKNSLAVKAIEGTSLESLKKYFKGMTSVAFSYSDAVAPAKSARKSEQEFDKFKIKAGFVQGKVLEPKDVDVLSKLPGIHEQRSILLGVVLAPAQKLLAQVSAPAQQLVGVIDAYAKKTEA